MARLGEVREFDSQGIETRYLSEKYAGVIAVMTCLRRTVTIETIDDRVSATPMEHSFTAEPVWEVMGPEITEDIPVEYAEWIMELRESAGVVCGNQLLPPKLMDFA